MKNELILVSGITPELSITPDAQKRRDELLAVARKGTTVSSPESAERASVILKDIKAFTRLIESSRKEVKAPVLEISKKIDGIADTLSKELDAEADRISRILGAYQAEQARIAEEGRRKALEEEQRILREAEEKAREEARKAAAEAEALRLKEERARSVQKQEQYAAQAKLAAERAEAEAKQREAELERQIIENRTKAASVVAPKPAGIATRSEICFEVTDAVALYEAAPYLVTLTPNVSSIKAALKGLSEGQKLPGVRHWTENKTIVR